MTRRRRCVALSLALAISALGGSAARAQDLPYDQAFVLFKGTMPTELGPSAGGAGDGNTYGPEVHIENGVWRMWYGGQGTDGRERIHYAESTDGITWNRTGVVLDDPNNPLIEDATIVVSGGVYHMFYTGAQRGTLDEIYHAISYDGLSWTRVGKVLQRGPLGSWDGLLVGRPSVMIEDGVWKMWFDGCQGFWLGVGVEPCLGFRNVGYATSPDGYHWSEYPNNPIFPVDESVHVSRYRGTYIMLGENQQGTRIATSPDGIAWTDKGYLVHLSGQPYDQYGHITPFLLYGADGRPLMEFLGLARDSCWCQNLMGAVRFHGDELDAYVT